MRTPLVLLPLLLLTLPQDTTPTTAEVADAYVRATFQQRDVARSAELLAPDALFVDPTAETFSRPLAAGLRGREAIRALQASWGIVDFGFEPVVRFDCGEYAVCAGPARFSYADGTAYRDVPFATVLRVREGHVLERHDRGDYRRMVPDLEPSEPELEELARAYLDAYLGRRFDELAELASDDVSFQDPTGAKIGAGREVHRRERVREHLRHALGGALAFELETEFSFFFHRSAVFAGTCRFSFPGASLGVPVETAAFELPMLVVLEVRDGEVVAHRDWVDYDGYVERLAAYRER